MVTKILTKKTKATAINTYCCKCGPLRFTYMLNCKNGNIRVSSVFIVNVPAEQIKLTIHTNEIQSRRYLPTDYSLTVHNSENECNYDIIKDVCIAASEVISFFKNEQNGYFLREAQKQLKFNFNEISEEIFADCHSMSAEDSDLLISNWANRNLNKFEKTYLQLMFPKYDADLLENSNVYDENRELCFDFIFNSIKAISKKE